MTHTMKGCTKCAPDSCSDPIAHAVFMTPTKERVGHTRGTWKATLTDELIGSRYRKVYEISSDDSIRWLAYVQAEADGDANARLIAAAPQLLDALRSIESTYVFLDSMIAGMEPQHTNTVNALAAVRAAIRAAEGE